MRAQRENDRRNKIITTITKKKKQMREEQKKRQTNGDSPTAKNRVWRKRRGESEMRD